jgi:hypothetical protein
MEDVLDLAMSKIFATGRQVAVAVFRCRADADTADGKYRDDSILANADFD